MISTSKIEFYILKNVRNERKNKNSSFKKPISITLQVPFLENVRHIL